MENINIAEPLHTTNVMSKSVNTDLIFSFFHILHKAILGIIDIVSSLVGLLSWPVIVLVAILIFRKALINRINHLSSIGTDGAKFYNPQSHQSKEKESSTDKLSSIPEGIHPLIEKWIPKVERLLEEKARTLGKSKDSISISTITDLYLALEFEKIYGLIFGSQITLLCRLRDEGNSLPVGEARNIYYLEGKKVWPNIYKNYAFEAWLRYLITLPIELIKEDEKGLNITKEGIAFLNHIIAKKYYLNKVG